MKKFLVLVLTVIMIASIIPFGAITAHAEEGEKLGPLEYKITNNKVEIIKCDEEVTGTLEIPKEINGCPVVEIRWQAFYSCRLLTEIIIPEGVETIGYRAFWDCSSLKVLNIPDSVSVIDEGAFDGCISLETINVPKGIEEIKRGTFQDCESLVNVNLPDTVTTICELAFYRCLSLENIVLPDSIKTIEEKAFYHCENLKSIEIPSGVTKIGDAAFASCEKLTNVYYGGTLNKKEKIQISEYNDNLKDANWICADGFSKVWIFGIAIVVLIFLVAIFWIIKRRKNSALR